MAAGSWLRLRTSSCNRSDPGSVLLGAGHLAITGKPNVILSDKTWPSGS